MEMPFTLINEILFSVIRKNGNMRGRAELEYFLRKWTTFSYECWRGECIKARVTGKWKEYAPLTFLHVSIPLSVRGLDKHEHVDIYNVQPKPNHLSYSVVELVVVTRC